MTIMLEGEIQEAADPQREALMQAAQLLKEQDALLQRVTAAPFAHARVLTVTEEPTVLVSMEDGTTLEVGLPEGLKLKRGTVLRLSMETKQVVGVAPVDLPAGGHKAVVQQELEGNMSIVSVDGEGVEYAVSNGAIEGLTKGDRVVINRGNTMVILNLGKEDDRFRFAEETSVTWDDIGGLQEAKQQMVEAIEWPWLYPDIYAAYGRKPVKGVLLYGPPGCGKTMLGKAVATALAGRSNSEPEEGSATGGFFYVKGPELLNMYVGETERAVRLLFEQAKLFKAKAGYPAVLFIDEADAILGKRGTGISSDIEKTIVPSFLTEMDGLEESGAVVILATNRPDILDPAVVRPGRIDRKIQIGRPDNKTTLEILNLYLKDVPFSGGYSKEQAAKQAAESLFSRETRLYDLKFASGKAVTLTLGDFASGAMIANLVERAKSLAMQREINSRAGGQKVKAADSGVGKADILLAVQQEFQEMLNLEPRDEVEDFVATRQREGDKFVSLSRH